MSMSFLSLPRRAALGARFVPLLIAQLLITHIDAEQCQQLNAS